MVGLVNCTALDKPALGGMSLKMKAAPADIVLARPLEDPALFEFAGGDCTVGVDVEPVMVACRVVIGSESALSTL